MTEAEKPDSTPAIDGGERPGPDDSPVQIRPSGKESMADQPEIWDELDEALDETFPASVPPTNY